MIPLTLTFCNRRGGCGKTTNAAAVAYALAYRGYDVLFFDTDAQTDASQFFLAKGLDEHLKTFGAKVKILQDQKIQAGIPEQQASEEALSEAEKAVPHSYGYLIDRIHIPENDARNKVRTLWEAMENFRILGAPSVPKEIVPMEILPRLDGTHGRLLLIPGHEDMYKMESHTHSGEAAAGEDPKIAWLTVPNHILKLTAEKHRCSIIVVDTNPFAGDYLRLLLMQSDYYAVMAGPDRGSTNAIQKLCGLVPEWYKYTRTNTFHKVHSTYPDLGRQYPFPKKEPKFLGIVLGNWVSKHNNAADTSKPASSSFSQGLSTDMPSNKFKALLSSQWLEAKNARSKLAEVQYDQDVHGLNETVSFAPTAKVFKDLNLVDSLLGRVRNFAGLKVNSEHFGIPVQYLQGKHLEIEWDADGKRKRQKKSSTDSLGRVQFFRKVYDQIVWNMLAIIHHDSQPDAAGAAGAAGGAGGGANNAALPWVDMPIDLSPWGLGGPPKLDENFYSDEVKFDVDSDDVDGDGAG